MRVRQRARRLPAVNYSFNLSANPEEPILFLLSGDAPGASYCGSAHRSNKTHLSKGFTEEFVAKDYTHAHTKQIIIIKTKSAERFCLSEKELF